MEIIMSDKKIKCDIGFIGLGVMGKNLVLNLVDNGYSIAAFDVDPNKVSEAVFQDEQESTSGAQRVFGCNSFEHVIDNIKSPHIIVLSVPAGDIVDSVCQSLIKAGIAKDDIIIDTGNSLWTDTIEREKRYEHDFLFFSSAVSGGEVGARFGPALMPSGPAKAWPHVEPIWSAIAAKVDSVTGKPLERSKPGDVITGGEPCSDYIGPAGAGHYVKMVHNGIEYADMQLICEAYHIMRSGLGLDCNAIADIFATWNKGVLDSYLMEISAEVLRHVEPETKRHLVDLILDKAGQKGTGLWTAMSSLEIGCPAPTIAQAVFARSLSSFKALRIESAAVLSGPSAITYTEQEKSDLINQIHDALYCSKICAYAQGFQLMKMASKEREWNLNFASIAKIWRSGCIIRAAFLQKITDAFNRNADLENLFLDEFFANELATYQQSWRQGVAKATLMGIPVGAVSASLGYYDSMRCETLPANLLQGQRDYFGAHTFSRIDHDEAIKYHVNWSEKGQTLTKVN